MGNPNTSKAAGALAAAGALSGLKAWTAYWVIESIFSGLLHWLRPSGEEFRMQDPRFAILALGAYVIAGAVGGALIALCTAWLLPGRAAKAIPFAGPLSLALAFVLHIRTVGGWRVQIFVAVLLAGALVASLYEAVPERVLAPAANVWCVGFALLVYPFAVDRYQGHASGRWLGAVGVLLAFLLSFAAGRWTRRQSARMRSRLGDWVLCSAVIITGLGYYFTSRQQPILSGVAEPAAGRAQGHPSVILITLDTVRADHLSLYGYNRDTSPHLKEFARDATVFTHAIAASDMTLASHASIFTGLYASQHGAHWALPSGQDGVAIGPEFALRLAENCPTLAKILASHGYRTMAIAANVPYLQTAFQLDQGFQYYSLPLPRVFLDQICPFCLRTDLARLVGEVFPSARFDLLYVRAGSVNREAFRLLNRQKPGGQPFFLFLNYMDAHQPYFPPAPYDTRYPGKDPSMTIERYWPIEFQALSGARPYTDLDRRRDESQYDGAIAYLDASLGALFTKLKQRGLYQDCLIVVTSDHGQSFGEKGLVGHGSSVYQEQVDVPLIIKYPGKGSAGVRNELVSHVDLAPTILQSLGYASTGWLAGHSLQTVQNDPVKVFSESFPCGLLVSLSSRFRRLERAAFSEQFKIITATNGVREFYDLSSDPHEERNLYGAHTPAARMLEAALAQWVSGLPANQSRPAQLDPRSLRLMKSLGYLQ